MAAEINWVYPIGMGILGTLFFYLFIGNRTAVPVRQKYQRKVRK